MSTALVALFVTVAICTVIMFLVWLATLFIAAILARAGRRGAWLFVEDTDEVYEDEHEDVA